MTANGVHRPGDPTASAGAVEAPVRPVLGPSRGLRGRAGLVGVGAVAIAILGAGIGFGGRNLVANPGSGPVSASGPVSPTERAATSPGSTATATGVADLAAGCQPATASTDNGMRLRSSRGEGSPTPGEPPRPGATGTSPPTNEWPIPPAEAAMLLDRSSSLVLVPDDGACLTGVLLEAIRFEEVGGEPDRLTADEFDLPAPRSRLVAPPLDDGDWLVHAQVRLWNPIAWWQPTVDRFFRVTTVGPAATPLVTPAVACVPSGHADPLPELALAVGDGAPVPGVDPIFVTGAAFDILPVVGGAFPDPVQIRPAGDVCATSWLIEYHAPGTVDPYFGVSVDNPGERASYVSQNRIDLEGVPLGDSIVSATVRFGPLRSVRAVWALRLDGPPPPLAEATGPDGQAAIARPGCGTSWTIGGGVSSSEFCSTTPVPEDLGLLEIRAGDVVTLDVPGWQVRSWSVSCGIRSSADPIELEQPTECGLGGAGNGAEIATEVGPARFIPLPGRMIVLVWVQASRAGDTVAAAYLVEIDART